MSLRTKTCSTIHFGEMPLLSCPILIVVNIPRFLCCSHISPATKQQLSQSTVDKRNQSQAAKMLLSIISRAQLLINYRMSICKDSLNILQANKLLSWWAVLTTWLHCCSSVLVSENNKWIVDFLMKMTVINSLGKGYTKVSFLPIIWCSSLSNDENCEKQSNCTEQRVTDLDGNV